MSYVHIYSITSWLPLLISKNYVPYARHYNPLLIWNRSWILTVHKIRILRKKLLEKTFLAFKNGVKSIHTAVYNGTRTVHTCCMYKYICNMYAKNKDILNQIQFTLCTRWKRGRRARGIRILRHSIQVRRLKRKHWKNLQRVLELWATIS